ncbi:MAG: rRNA maturation RNase YbeY [Candidatus Zambryskibacteria bacterium RIFCSPHIGHO2_02_FULL_43_14]|uniref:Endoribonuclease YbeY n=1 Tax=Candidatus Zambryskibacteria bacterium RIFCSPHIGHO2_02_FULL_43_14 TaxID=1802748 RepID=A0A1G2TFD9_9BACT|nr:MAG: rRNA maturation RNase YbeY [Candidatus Zambryskibacteria bacterium RIFCSPHIGHO2_01_FULL_43_60]OHA95953.1 MAG: rRNA maturation RNase YbeY [Candidatus Zambryskibacteria bacterium RIFCSPHIGHO2_02_FULL_43_14]OHB03647.1 MAG: rRNA maturation RNase YbeY [Candidatus Zambryskibacteria bacterium RIFCSPLOWO2_01_FULL_42_41]
MKSVNSRADTKNFEKIKNKVLGSDYELSLVFASDTLTRRLNRTYRGIDKPTNVLAFPLSKTSGEIFINRTRAKPFSVKYLFIHACLHLKGMEHGDTMEQAEKKLLNDTSNRSRY